VRGGRIEIGGEIGDRDREEHGTNRWGPPIFIKRISD
jgi:hypothetical protein